MAQPRKPKALGVSDIVLDLLGRCESVDEAAEALLKLAQADDCLAAALTQNSLRQACLTTVRRVAAAHP